MHEVKTGSEQGIVALWDRDHPRHNLKDNDVYRLSKELRQESTSGKVFWFEPMGDEFEAVSYTMHIYIDEDTRNYPDNKFKQRGGTFLLNIPSGRLVAGGVEYWSGQEEKKHSAFTEIEIPPGHYSLTGREQDFEVEQYNAEMIALLGEQDWKFYQRIDRYGALGCLPLIGCIVLALLKKWHVLLFYLLPFTVLYWGVQGLIRRFGRWARIHRKIKENRQHLPYFILELRSIKDPSTLKGGSVRIG